MRLFLAAITVVTSFICGVLLIARLLPFAGTSLKLTLAFAWLLGSIFAAWLVVGNQTVATTRGEPDRITERARVRDNLLYLAIALTLVTMVTALAIYDAERGIHRKFRDDWVVGFGSALFVFGYAAKAFWGFRKNWRMWAAMAALFGAFVGLVVPILSHMDRVPLLLMTPLFAVGSVIVQAALNWVVARQFDGNDARKQL
jgi:hypothetical protein